MGIVGSSQPEDGGGEMIIKNRINSIEQIFQIKLTYIWHMQIGFKGPVALNCGILDLRGLWSSF